MPPIVSTQNEFITYEIEEGILYASFTPGIIIDLSAARKILSDRIEMTGNEAFPSLVDSTGVKSFTKEARDYLSSSEGRVGVKATAILISGYLSSTIANFFLKVTVRKPVIPTRIFSDKVKALAWLQQFK
jgi:hypothetical protein